MMSDDRQAEELEEVTSVVWMTSAPLRLRVCLSVRGRGWLDVGRGLRRQRKQKPSNSPPAAVPTKEEKTGRQADRRTDRGHADTDYGDDGRTERSSVALCCCGRSSRMSVALQDLRNTVSARVHTHTYTRARARASDGDSCVTADRCVTSC